MRIRFVTPWYGEFAGGAEFAARNLAENLLKKGVDVGVLTTCCKTPFEDWWTDFYTPGNYNVNGVYVRRFPVNKDDPHLYHQINYKISNGIPISNEEGLSFMRGCINSHALISFIKLNKECLYVFIPYLYGPTFWGVNAVPDRSIIMPCLHNEAEAKWGIIKEIFLKARKIIFLSEEERELAGQLYSPTMLSMPVLGIGIDTGVFCDAKRFREKYRIKDKFLIYVGRKVNGKNIPILIDYFKQYIELYDKNMKIVFVGEGDASLIPKDNPNFVDLSYIPEQDKFDAIAASAALCNLSDNESFSFVIMESWLTGRPVIVSSKGAVTKSHCVKSNGGFCVSNADEFCMNVKQLLEREELASKLGGNGRRYVLNNYSWNKIIDGYINLFESIK